MGHAELMIGLDVADQPNPLLLTLEEVSQLISSSHDAGETLGNIVGLIKGRMQTDVCSVYLFEPERDELVLGATLGLLPESVGRVRMRIDEGLTGLVAQSFTPVMVEEASSHPRFKYFPEAGEDRYHSFLGVPLIEAGAFMGVLVIQTVEARRFSPDEVRMLVTVASQLVPLVSEARLLEQIAEVAKAPSQPSGPPGTRPQLPTVLEGMGLSEGVGVGQVYLTRDLAGWSIEPSAGPVDEAAERARLARAVEAACVEISHLSRRISEIVGESHGAILQAQLMILQDRSMQRDISNRLAAGRTAEAAIVETLETYIAAFQKLSNPMFQERVFDVKDIGRRLLWHLRPTVDDAADPEGERIVLVAPEASVLDLFAVDPDRLAAVVFEDGGPQSHAAILARSLGIPTVGRVPGLIQRLRPGQRLRVDGTAGRIEFDPAPALIERAPTPVPATSAASLGPESSLVSVGLPRVDANINLLYEVDRVLAARAGAVGLYRTEFLFLARRTLPAEEEQVDIYRKLLRMLGGLPVNIRTFDLRADKLAQCAHVSPGAATQYDWRRVLESQPAQALFRDQVRAIMRAAVDGPARILVPLVTRTEQLDFVLEAIEDCRAELEREGLEYDRNVPVGIMIETAAAVPQVREWSERVEFVALGTNDLTASALALDRDDPIGMSSIDVLHPGLLRLIDSAIRDAHRAHRPISVCGELAAISEGAIVLAALGIDSVSVPADRIEQVRLALSNLQPGPLERLAHLVRSARTAREVREALQPRLATIA